ncbi:MAG: ABC transporter ATP-binding protein [Clostridia bacterium]|nr:ABC transporter ATP-binding protein [Clostridia bacterium]
MNGKDVPEPAKRKRADNIIPDYAYLFEEDAEKKGKRKTKFFSRLVKLNLRQIIYSTFVYLLQASPVFIMPLITANIIDITTDALGSAELITARVWYELGINAAVLFFFILQNIPTTIWRWRIVSKMLRRTSAGIKCAVVRKLQSLSITYHKDLESGKIQSKFLKDTDSVDSLFNCFMFNIIPNVIGVLIATAISVYKNGLVALFFLFVIPANVGITFAFRKKIRNRNRDYRLKTESMSTRLSTMVEMYSITKAHGLEQTEIASVEKSIKTLEGSGLEMDKTLARFGASAWVVSVLLSAVCLVFCAVLALYGYITIGEVVLYQSMFATISGYVSALVNTAPQLGSGFEALRSISEIMNVKDVEINIGKPCGVKIKGNVEFKDISYKYPNTSQLVVKNLNFSVKEGECIAVVGSSGSGKSTIMNLIIGLLKPVDGCILIDGKPLGEYNLSEYRHNISVVPQNSILFSGTIRDNITYGLANYSEEDLLKAVKMANLNEFLEQLPNGINTVIGEHGDKLSGGQKQRITIARALIRNPAILILDEATSALDNISEYHVQKAISSSIKGRTTFIVAHRLSTIRDADRILVMENGQCVESGTFEELLAKKGKFYELKTLNDVNMKAAETALG